MGHLARKLEPRKQRDNGCGTLKPTRFHGRTRRSVLALFPSLSLVLALVIMGQAQSGRNHQTHQTTNRNASSGTGSTRPRRTAATTSTVVPAPSPTPPARSPANQLLYPVDTREIGEPPSWPTPKPTPTPAPITSTVRPAANAAVEEVEPSEVIRTN